MFQRRFVPLPIALVAAAATWVTAQVADSEQTPANATHRVFEIRTYTTEPGKLDALHARFRDHTTKLFAKHGMTNIGYWTPADEPRSKDTLVYIVAHANRQAAKENWQNFVNDPQWQKARDESEANGKIVKKIESQFVDPTDYSPLQ